MSHEYEAMVVKYYHLMWANKTKKDLRLKISLTILT